MLLVGMGLVVAASLTSLTIRYVRSWWVGITSVSMLLAFLLAIWMLDYAGVVSGRLNAVFVTTVVLITAMDSWRLASQRRPTPSDIGFNILNAERRTGDTSSWATHNFDDPISEWNNDIIGRAAVVELLADHILKQRTPVVALHGRLGDGKSSVLRLLARTIDRRASVVSFTARLPGSDATLATELFKNIAIECRKRLYVPQLRRRTLMFARLMSDSVPHLGGLKGIVPAQSQREEVEELRDTFSRVPVPIAVLVDEIDRMHKEELFVLLKILRGACSIQNVTFVCAFSDEEVKRELGKDDRLSRDYMEKFFPVSIRLSPPPSDMIASCLIAQLREQFGRQGWFPDQDSQCTFVTQIKETWNEALKYICTNLRKAGRLLNDIIAAGEPICGEVNPTDLVLIEAIRVFFPTIHELVRHGGKHLTQNDGGPYSLQSEKQEMEAWFGKFKESVAAEPESEALTKLLCSLFPSFARSLSNRRFVVRATLSRRDSDNGRICDAEFFEVYFRSVVPEEMCSNAL